MKTKKEVEQVEKPEIGGLCLRCEHRIRAMETHGKLHPKYECSDFTMSKGSCYMYMPVKPVNLKIEKGDKRPIGIPMLGARMNPTDKQEDFRDTLECVAVSTKKKGEFTLIYKQKKEIKKSKGKTK